MACQALGNQSSSPCSPAVLLCRYRRFEESSIRIPERYPWEAPWQLDLWLSTSPDTLLKPPKSEPIKIMKIIVLLKENIGFSWFTESQNRPKRGPPEGGNGPHRYQRPPHNPKHAPKTPKHVPRPLQDTKISQKSAPKTPKELPKAPKILQTDSSENIYWQKRHQICIQDTQSHKSDWHVAICSPILDINAQIHALRAQLNADIKSKHETIVLNLWPVKQGLLKKQSDQVKQIIHQKTSRFYSYQLRPGGMRGSGWISIPSNWRSRQS